MKAATLQACCLSILLAVTGAAQADPFSALLGLIIAEKVTAKKSDKAEQSPPWRSTLSSPELETLDSLKNHPALSTCMRMADEENAIAEYNLRKVGEFSHRLRTQWTRKGQSPHIASQDYEPAAKAFRWCSEQSGTVAETGKASLLADAYGLSRLVASAWSRERTLLSRNDY